MVAASIRSNNPGAMWGKGNKLAEKWGSTGTESLKDGLGQGNNIAYFPTKVQGACAQFDFWHSSNHYHNKTLREAITTWSGGNWVSSYLKFLKARVPGLTDDTVIDDAFLSGPKGIQLMKAQANHEAGQPYPMTDVEWAEAQRRVFAASVVAQAPIQNTFAKDGYVRRGDKDTSDVGPVHALQQWLRDAKYDIAVDGDYGPQTEGAVLAWKGLFGLKQVAEMSPTDLNMLKSNPPPPFKIA